MNVHGDKFVGLRSKQDTSKGLRRDRVWWLKGCMMAADHFASAGLQALEMNCIKYEHFSTTKQDISKSGNVEIGP